MVTKTIPNKRKAKDIIMKMNKVILNDGGRSQTLFMVNLHDDGNAIFYLF